jgi:NADH-quinone oxidoreductase subunit E
MSARSEVPMDKGVPRFAHGSRVPGWDTPADLDKDPATIPDPATTPVPAELRAEIEAHMALYPETRSATLPALEAAQRVHGWCSPEAIEQVACVMRLTPADLAAVATFYDMLETEPVGRHSVYVCTNISCSLCGADALLAELENAADAADDGKLEFNVRAFECLGACDIAPMASVDGVYVGPLTIEDVPALLDDVRAGRPVLPEKQLARKRVADPYANTREFPLHEAEHTARAGNADAVRTPPQDTGAESSPGERGPDPSDSEGGA